jgi:hypothetical protein
LGDVGTLERSHHFDLVAERQFSISYIHSGFPEGFTCVVSACVGFVSLLDQEDLGIVSLPQFLDALKVGMKISMRDVSHESGLPFVCVRPLGLLQLVLHIAIHYDQPHNFAPFVAFHVVGETEVEGEGNGSAFAVDDDLVVKEVEVGDVFVEEEGLFHD